MVIAMIASGAILHLAARLLLNPRMLDEEYAKEVQQKWIPWMEEQWKKGCRSS
jgi:hypothetical protein